MFCCHNLLGLQELDQYNPADVAMSLCRMISYNIGQLAYLNAKRWVGRSFPAACVYGLLTSIVALW